MADNNKITYGSDNPYYVETKKQLDSVGKGWIGYHPTRKTPG